MTHSIKHTFGRQTARVLLAAVLAGVASQPLFAQSTLSQAVIDQLVALKQDRAARTDFQKKMSSHVWLVLQESRGRTLPGADDLHANAREVVRATAAGQARVSITADVSDSLTGQITALGGRVRNASARGRSIQADVPLSALETLAARSDVQRIAPAAMASTNVGALTSQGYVSHRANQVVTGLGYNGNGVKVGVLSDSVEAMAALKASGDLPASAYVLPGQEGVGDSEGTAMMEIIYDMAPGAQLIFATAFDGVASFADNIRALRAAGADIIVDDVSYYDEGVFQDGPIAKAVNDVVASGALYFSSAGNSGNVTSGTAGAWEGDYNPGAAAGPVFGPPYTLHRFSGTQDYNTLTASTSIVTLKWSDPLGASGNDYDLFVTNSTGTALLCVGGDTQAGGEDPVELCYRSAGMAAGSRVYVGNYLSLAAPRALHLNTNRGRLQFATTGVVYGHNAGRNTVSTAATYWNSAKTGTKPFVGGAANPTETFSSDGPRRIFYQPNGSPITPGNIMFATNGGELLAKPDLTAADGVSTKTPGFLPFFGTSAAAPHAAAIAALVKSARPSYTNLQILDALKQTAMDIRAPGVDRDSGVGIVNALNAVNWALTH